MGRNQYSGNKPANFKETFAKLIQYCRPEWVLLILAVCCAVGGSILNLQGPARLSDITDTITEGLMSGVDMDKLAGMFAVLIAIYAGGFLLTYLQSFFMATVTQALSKRMRKEVDSKINKVPMGFFNKVSYGDILSRVTNDVDTIGQALNQSVASLVSSATMFLGALLMMLLTNVWMTLAAVAAALLGFAVMILIVQ